MRVLQAGRELRVVGLPRPGRQRSGHVAGGAFDVEALLRAGAAVGNAAGLLGLESVLGGVALLAEEELLVAVAGAPAPLRVDGVRWGPRLVPLAPGQRLDVGTAAAGLRVYVAVAGGLAGPPRVVRAGERLEVGEAGWSPSLPAAEPEPASDVVLPATWGPRADWFTAAARELFGRTTWDVTGLLDRVGIRLDGPALQRSVTRELLSEGCVPLAVQVPADGRPILFGVDHPATGGYPVIAVADPGARSAVAQLRPGARVRFDVR